MIKINPQDLLEIERWYLQQFKEKFWPVFSNSGGLSFIDRAFLEFIRDNIETIIAGKPQELDRIVETVDNRFQPEYNREYKRKGKEKKKPKALYKRIERVFNYDKFCNNANAGWNAYTLMERLGVLSCPYCNRAYTHTLFDASASKKEVRRTVRPDFDHFIDKASYPFLALSFYNLIPSCLVCNSRHKGSAPFRANTHVHPYAEEFGQNAQFRLKIKASSFFGGDSQAAKLEFVFKGENPELEARIRRSINAFKLEDHYNEHIDYVYEIVVRSLMYPEEYIDDLLTKYNGPLFRTKEELLRFVHANYVNEEMHLKRPLSKLTNDILEQFG